MGGSLNLEPPDAAEMAGLLRTGCARLVDARNTTLALESRFDLAYNATHALCHNKRNLGEYEGMLNVDERLLKDLILATQRVADALSAALGPRQNG